MKEAPEPIKLKPHSQTTGDTTIIVDPRDNGIRVHIVSVESVTKGWNDDDEIIRGFSSSVNSILIQERDLVLILNALSDLANQIVAQKARNSEIEAFYKANPEQSPISVSDAEWG